MSSVQCRAVATCQKASSNSGTISARAIGLRRRHTNCRPERSEGPRIGPRVAGRSARSFAALRMTPLRLFELAAGELVGELRIEEGLELRQGADLLEVEHVLGVGLGLADHRVVELPDV